MSPITERDFQSTLQLSDRVKSALFAAFEGGWSEPQKIHQPSAKVRQALGQAREVIAKHLAVQPGDLEFVGELGFAFWSAISGLRNSNSDSMIHSAIDRQIVHAFGREIANSGGRTRIIEVDSDGAVNFDDALIQDSDSILAWQATNRETGVEQIFPKVDGDHRIFADLTARFNPKLSENVDVAIWDPRSFGGPEGIAILAIPNKSKWRSPIPQIDQRRLFGSYSKPLLLATAVALDQWMSELEERRQRLFELNIYARSIIESTLPCRIVGALENSDPRNLALVFEGVIAEELLREVEISGYLLDAGSACGAGALEPSHVLSALGFGRDGHIRLTLKEGQSHADIAGLCTALKAAVVKLAS